MDYIKGRGAQINPDNRFFEHNYEKDLSFLQHLHQAGEKENKPKTEYIQVHPKTIVNKVTSPDLGFSYSMNPYQGCEHGCIYCYARNTHEYWGYSAGTDFESKILIKENAADLLRAHFKSKSWRPSPIMLSGNTDCYQPIERKLKITRSLLEVCLKYRHPVGLITKNAMILRDLDILSEMARMKLAKVVISLTSLKDKTRSILEPRTSAVGIRLNAIRSLSDAGIPTMVMMAPIIPSINNMEIMKLAEKVAENGATDLAYTIIRLNGIIPEIFTDWLEKNYPDRVDKVLNQIKDLHGGTLNDSRFKLRMRGEGELSNHIHQMFAMAKRKYGLGLEKHPFDLKLFRRSVDENQLELF
ncbi:MAG: PA0069 family radical SAM protein [Reichenbachiella sp.]|uniref:PA0069 family radical SAM protein n=2 Tax=Reichenbachiella sp. TaxID=2184521 RepID=UPI0032640058